MTKIDLRHVTFNIPFKADHIERIENLELVIDYLTHFFDTNIIVYEQGKDKPSIKAKPNIRIVFDVSNGPFHRTRYLNDMALLSRTPIIVNYDCDVLIKPENYVKAARVLTEASEVAGILPYDGRCFNISRIHIPRIKAEYDLSFIEIEKTESNRHLFSSVGGALFWNRSMFIRYGMENENFISWGWEDYERIVRSKTLGGIFFTISGPLYHLGHPSGKDSGPESPYLKRNNQLYNEILKMKVEDLKRYITTQPWMDFRK